MKSLRAALLMNVCILQMVRSELYDVTRELKSVLFKNYDPYISPATAEGKTLNVSMDLSLWQITSMDEKQQVFSAKIVLFMGWDDPRLQWNLTAYNVSVITVPKMTVWFPDVTLYNDLHDFGKYQDRTTKGDVMITPDGNVQWSEMRSVQTICFMEVSDFPFDLHNCSMSFMSWLYTSKAMRLEATVNANGQDKFYIESMEWDLRNVTVSQQKTIVLENNEDHITFDNATYFVVIRRRSGYYLFHQVAPSLMILFVGFLSYLLPADGGERVSVCITSLLTIVVFLLMVADRLPASAAVSLLAHYFIITIILLLFTCLMNIIVINLHKFAEDEVHVPACLNRFLRSKCIVMVLWLPFGKRKTRNLKDTSGWILLAKLMDEILFLFSVTITIALGIWISSYHPN